MSVVRRKGDLFFLLHPGEVQFSGYGLTVEPGNPSHLVGLLMVDRPQPVSAAWLQRVKETFGGYELYPITKTGERGMACQMWIAEDSVPYVRQVPGSFTRLIQEALFPLLLQPPKPQFLMSWDETSRLWRSEFYPAPSEGSAAATPKKRRTPLFPLGQVVATPGALDALTAAGQLPQEFLYRHVLGDWGELDEHDRQANDAALREGNRLLSAYTTRKGARLWIITEWNREVTTILTPGEY